MGMLKPVNVFAASSRETTGYFGVHPFIEQHPEAVFIMHTNVDVKTNGDANQGEGTRFANEVLVPKDKTGFPTSQLIPIKPNITGGGGNSYNSMGIITDPRFVEGVIEGMKQLGIPGKQFHLREVNGRNWEKHVYYPVAQRTGADLHNMSGRVSAVDVSKLRERTAKADPIPDDEVVWVDIPNGMVLRKFAYLWPIHAPNTFLMNIAKFKAHEMGLTLCIKNFQGACANPYQLCCWKMESVLMLPKEHVNPNAQKDNEASYKRHVNTIPRWDRTLNVEESAKGQGARDIRDVYDAVCQEIWTNRTLDSISATKFNLCVIEGIYGRDGDFGIGPNPEGNEDNPRGKAWDYMTNIVIFGMDPFRVDIVGKWLGGHEPGNFGLFHIAMERGLLDVMNPMNIPVYHWENHQAVMKPLTWFNRTPLKTFYLQRNYNGGTEPFWHLCDEPFDYSQVSEVKSTIPSRPGARVLTQANQTASYQRVPIEYSIPEKGNVTLEILNDKGETVVIPVIAIRDRGTHLTSWDTSTYESGKYAYRFRWNDYSETREILLQKS